jgi:hypothetical protein
MKTIRIQGTASNNSSEGDCYFHGLKDDENFVEYMDGHLQKKLEQNAFMRFEIDPKRQKLLTIVEYKVVEPLTDSEVKELAEYTQGQWSDGIGENFEQQSLGRELAWDEYEEDEIYTDIYLSPWHKGQVLEIFVDGNKFEA